MHETLIRARILLGRLQTIAIIHDRGHRCADQPWRDSTGMCDLCQREAAKEVDDG